MHKTAISMGVWALCACRSPQSEPLHLSDGLAVRIAESVPDVAALSCVLDDPNRVESARIAAKDVRVQQLLQADSQSLVRRAGVQLLGASGLRGAVWLAEGF